MTVVERHTTTEPCPPCARARPRPAAYRAEATVSWDVVAGPNGRRGRPVRLRCPNGHDTDDGANLWMWLGERGF